MERLPDKYRLMEAMLDEDWETVKGICVAKPHLVNTKDKSDAGFNVIHLLAEYGCPLALRRALEKTTTEINKRNFRGQTLLHWCLRSSLSSYDTQRDVALCLMTYGASLAIKDEDGKTPLDLYDDNQCREYEFFTRDKKKNELRKLLVELSVPGEVFARAEDAIKAFEDAIQNGITSVYSRIMFFGKEGAGKTSCINAMLGNGFKENELATDGIVTTPVFQTVGENCSKWQKMKDLDVLELTKQIHEHAIAAHVAKKVTESQQNISKTAASDPGRTSPSGSTASSMEKIEEATSIMTLDERGKPCVSQWAGSVSINQPMKSQANRLERKLPYGIHEKLVDILGCNFGLSGVICIWDYAGPLKYYITNHFFLTDGSSYGVVFSLLDDLNALAKPRDSQQGQFEMTNLQLNVFWIRSIYEHAILPQNAKKRHCIDGINISSPPISLIATHKDRLSGSEEDKETLIKARFTRIFDEIKGTEYESHVDREMYAVDNTAAWDEGIEKLKKNVGGYMKKMAKTIPINWVHFQCRVQEVGKTTVRISLDKVTKIAVKCEISKENIIHVLTYLNDLGIIFYSPTNEKLRNTVITNIHMLIGIFTKITRVVKPDDLDKWPTLMKSWNLFDDEGILCEALLRHLWRNELQGDESNFEVFLELLKLFGLLLEKQKESKENGQTFIVPSRIKIIKESLEVKKDEKQMVSIYLTPTDFLPDAVYNILVVAFVDLMKAKGRRGDAELFRNRSDFDLDDDHLVSLGAVIIKNRHALKLEISHRIDEGENGGNVSEPHPSVCMEVLNYLRHQLKTVYVTSEGIGYKLCVLCNACQHMQQPHLHDLEDCLMKDKVPCGKRSTKTSRIKRLFSTSLKPEIIEETKNFQAIQSLIIDLGTRKMKEFFLKTAQQTSSSVVEFLKNEKKKRSFVKMKDFQGQDKMFLPNADVNTFDVAILMRLIRYCCRFTYPDDIWEQPDKIDNSDLANLIRIQQYKSIKLDQNTSCRIPAKDFDKEWNGIKEIFLELGVPDKEIEDMRLRKGFVKTDIEEMQNFQAIMSLVVDLGTEAMRKYFLQVSNLKEKNIGQFLINEKSSFQKAELLPEQESKMFPTKEKADIKSFDISIMFKIIRNCSPRFSFWSEPDKINGNVLANIVRIHQYRNTRLAHSASARMPTEIFEVEWRNLTSILQGVGVSIEDIDKYKQLRLII